MTVAQGEGSHTEGYQSYIYPGALAAHAEGKSTTIYDNCQYAHVEGWGTEAYAEGAHVEGNHTKADGAYSHVSGQFNVADNIVDWPTWIADTSYAVGDKVKITSNNKTIGYICKNANTDSVFTVSNWTNAINHLTYAEIVGNGTAINARSNARALDWQGNEYLNGTLYINCNRDSTGGSAVATEATVTALTARVAALEAEIASLTAALQAFLVPANAVTMENGEPMTDENGNYIEFDVPTT